MMPAPPQQIQARATLFHLLALEGKYAVQGCRYVQALAPSQEITQTGVQAAYQLTQGDGRAIRHSLHFLLPYDPALDDMDAIGEQYSQVSLNRGAAAS